MSTKNKDKDKNKDYENSIFVQRFIANEACMRLSKLTNKPSRTIKEELQKEFQVACGQYLELHIKINKNASNTGDVFLPTKDRLIVIAEAEEHKEN